MKFFNLMLLLLCLFVGAQSWYYCTYTIKSGDTLWGISRRFGVTIDDIMWANEGSRCIANRNLIYAGCTIYIPYHSHPGVCSTDPFEDTIENPVEDLIVV
eukprot:TRINITY_DN3997_c0_g1_i3.p4 TRINITY_DN3997_c0_g1~~TRINITY_DN3997_c0_g1_i3.p4  ORF type:complete len:100 (-),score=5.32 TRINITY_DN3997_c0_g1_i3:876-1175(-)